MALKIHWMHDNTCLIYNKDGQYLYTEAEVKAIVSSYADYVCMKQVKEAQHGKELS